MAIDIALSLLRTLASEGVTFSRSFFTSLLAGYRRRAQDAIREYHADAVINQLKFDRHKEERMVEVFRTALRRAGERFMLDPFGTPEMPNWDRVNAAVPDCQRRIRKVVEEDTKELEAELSTVAGASEE